MQQKIWKVKESVSADLLNQFPELSPLIVQLLSNRGLTSQKEVEAFLNPDFELQTHNPFLFKDMQKSVDRIYLAIANGEKITVHGDYDADGVDGSAILVTTIRDLGGVSDAYLPHREKEGYGVNINTIEYLATQNTKLIITVDCGSTNHQPVARANELGMDVIITDHHHAPDVFPSAFAILNPMNKNDTYPFKFICGTGVAFKLSQALFLTDQKSSHPKLTPGYDKWMLDLVAIGTIADMMPLIDENRALVKYGLIVLSKTRRPGLKKLMEQAGIWNYGDKINTPYDVGFVIGPRINAAGRMDHANAAFMLLMAKDEAEALPLVESIEASNRDRRTLTEKVVEEVMTQVGDFSDKYIVVAYGEGWPIGVAGLIASKVLEKVTRPVIIMTKMTDRIAASGRSVPGFDMAVALETMKDEFFATSGGHAMACGFSLKPGIDPKLVIERFEQLAKEALADRDLRAEINVDAELPASSVRFNILDLTEQLRPFGMKNPEPIFLTKNLEVVEVRKLGDKEQHLKLKLQDSSVLKTLSAIGFNIAGKYSDIKVGSKIDLVYKLDINEWNGNRELQLKIEDLNIL